MSPIKNDEVVQFFRTAGSWNTNKKYWDIPIHGWIYEPVDSTVRKTAVAAWLRTQYGLEATPVTEHHFAERVNLLLSDNERAKVITVVFGNHQVRLKPSHANGHFDGRIRLSAAEVEQLATDNIIRYKAIARDGREFVGESILLQPQGISLISDIDDTIKISQVSDRKQLIDHTFFQDFVAVPGMTQWYHSLGVQNTAIHFVSSSPWQLYEPLRRFTEQAQFPWATFSLKSFRFRDSTLLNLFKPGTATKPAQIEPILKRFPQRQFILVGDSGEVDPEVYADILNKHPQQILHIYIRNITDESRDNARFIKLMATTTESKWTLFATPPNAADSLP